MDKGIYLTWTNLSAHVTNKQILTDVSGYCEPGTTLAIMGPSGAGKTTLLSILAMKKSAGMEVAGEVKANNVQYDHSQFYNFGSFVYQNDILNQTLTVRETLEFAARLKLKNKDEALVRVNELIAQFGLRKCQDTYVGGKIVKGISGGQKKRVCIAVEIVAKPDLLILDEPTSGLDSNIANEVIKILNSLAKEGKTVIFTIHQPSYKIYLQLNRLLLLDNGRCIYQGLSEGIYEYMMSLSIQIPPKTTICDFFMFEISQHKARTQKYQTPLNSSQYSLRLRPSIEREIQRIEGSKLQIIEKRSAVHGFFEQLHLLFQRQFRLFMRNPMKLRRSIGTSILNIFIVGLIFYHGISDGRPHDAQIYNRSALMLYFIAAQGVCFVNVTSVIMSGIFSVVLVFPSEREVYSKQTSSKTFNTLPYFLTKLFIQLFSLLIGMTVFASGAYWLMGFRPEFLPFVKFILTLLVVAMVGNSIGLMTGSFFKDAQKATSMSPALILPMMMFSGLYNKLNSIPRWISWLQYISPFRYGLHALLLNQFEDQKYGVIGFPKPFDYKQEYSINLSFGENIAVLFSLSALYYALAFISLKKLSSTLSA